MLAQQIPRDTVTTVVGAKVRFMNETTKILNPTLRVIQANTPTLDYPELHERNADLTLARLAHKPALNEPPIPRA